MFLPSTQQMMQEEWRHDYSHIQMMSHSLSQQMQNSKSTWMFNTQSFRASGGGGGGGGVCVVEVMRNTLNEVL